MGSELDLVFIKKQMDKDSLKKLELIEKNYKEIFKDKKVIKNPSFFKVKLDGYTINLRKESSSPELMTYQEVWLEGMHVKAPGFKQGNNVIIDVGGNEGYYTLFMKKHNPHAKIIVLEPMPKTFETLSRNVKDNKLSNVHLIRKALTNKVGKTKFEFVPEVSAISSTNISLQERPWLHKKRIKSIVVSTTTLKELFKKFKLSSVDLLKLDVEGSEYEILTSGVDELKMIKRIIIEYHSNKLKEDCTKFLQEQGFKLVLAEKEESCGDIYFIRANN